MLVSTCCNLQGRNVVVFYGSQTGTAEDFAGRLARDASRYGMKAIVADPEESDMVWVSAVIIMFCYFHLPRFCYHVAVLLCMCEQKHLST